MRSFTKSETFEALTSHLTLLHENRALLERLRAASLSSLLEITWAAAGLKTSRCIPKLHRAFAVHITVEKWLRKFEPFDKYRSHYIDYANMSTASSQKFL